MREQTAGRAYVAADRRDFGLSSESAYIEGDRFKDKYATYQYNYQQQYGVLPEFDLVNRPFTAMADDVYYFYKNLRKRGFYGAWFYHDVHGFLNQKLKKLYNQYKKEWAFIFGFAPAIVEEINNRIYSGVEEKIENGLGYRVMDGIYYEGTWKNEKLIYGLMYNHDVFFVGTFDYDAYDHTLFHGVELDVTQNKKEELMEITCGTLYMRNNSLVPYEGEAVYVRGSTKDGISMNVCQYEEGYEHGKFYGKEMNPSGCRVSCAIMKDGDVKRTQGNNCLFQIIRILVSLEIMLGYYICKFTYGLPIYLIYRWHQKKNWL